MFYFKDLKSALDINFWLDQFVTHLLHLWELIWMIKFLKPHQIIAV